MAISTEYAAKQTSRIVFDLTGRQDKPAQVILVADSLPSSNAKPLL